MFAYTTTSYPTYSSPALYPHSHYIVTPSVPTARERYLRAVAEARAARARYLSELEEQRILAAHQQQEALRQTASCQRHIFAPQNHLPRRRAGHIYAENLCRPVASPQDRRQVFVRHPNENFFAAHEAQNPLKDLEAIVSALFQGGRDKEDAAVRENERVRAEEARKVDVLNDRVRFIKKLERALETTHADPNCTSTSQPFKPSTKATSADPSNVPPISRPTESPHHRLARDRAARAIQQRWRSRSAGVLARNDAFATIATLQARFQFLKATFSFPEHLEFREHVADQEQQAPALLFTPANAAVHAYTHELTKLLTLADAVPSLGSQSVREERRSFVRLVEEALDSVDRSVAKVWGTRLKGSVTIHSGTADTVGTSSPVPPNVVSAETEDSTSPDSEPVRSPSTDASTIIPSQTTTDIDPLSLNNIQASEVLSHSPDVTRPEVPSEEFLNLQHGVATTGSTPDDRDVAVETNLETIDTIQATKDAVDTASSSSTSSQSEPSEASQSSSVGNADVDVVSTAEEIDLTSGSSDQPGLTTPQSFDFVYPDAPPSSPLSVESNETPRETAQGLSVSVGGEAVSTLLEVESEVQKISQREIEEEETYELL